MSTTIFYIGTYTQMLSPNLGGNGPGIYTIALNNYTGALTILHTTSITNAGYLVRNQQYLYSVVEVLPEQNPKVVAFQIHPKGRLQKINQQSINGSLPCHINYAHQSILVACYGSGSVHRFPVNSSGCILPQSQQFNHQGSSSNKERQEAPHAHQIAIHPNQQDVLVPDLGIDTLKAYHIQKDQLLSNPTKDIAIPNGYGPRHLVFHPNGTKAYLINELTAQVTTLSQEKHQFVAKHHQPSLPKTFKQTPSASAIRHHPTLPFLYVANRTLEAITIYYTQQDQLVFVDHLLLNGKTVREFNITPNGSWLIACLHDSNDVYVFRILANGMLQQTYHTNQILAPVCVCF